MKKITKKRNIISRYFLLLFVLCVFGITKAYALEFVVNSPSNHELVCEIIDNDAKTVRIEPNYGYTYNGALVIPATVVYDNVTYTVVEIGSYVFKDQSSMTSVSIPSSVTTIGHEAFCNCTGLTGTLTIGENITSVNGGAFNNTGYSVLNYNARRMCTNENGDVCNYAAPMQDHVNGENGWLGNCASLTTINIGEHVEVIPARAFCYCRFTGELTIPNSVTIIGPNAFYHCQQLTGTLTIPESVLKIGDGAFCFCDGLTTLNFNPANFEGDAGCYYGYFPSQASGENKWFGSCPLLKTLHIGEAVTNITPDLFKGCRFEGEIVIPNTVTTVGYDAFTNCTGITEITIGEGVTSLGLLPQYGAVFNNCTSLTTVYFNAVNCADMSYYNLFENCPALTSLYIGNNVERIPSKAFKNCSFSGSVTIPNSVTELGREAFMGCSNITTITIGESLVNCIGASDGNGMFRGCTSLATVNYNAISCTNWVNYNTWSDCTSLTTLTIGPNVESIPNGIFKDCSFACNLVLPNSLLTIGDNAFQNCSGFTGDLIIPENVTSIGGNAFNGCSGFTGDLTIGNSVETIGEYAFANCTGLQGTLTIGESFSSCPDTWGKPFDNCSGLTTLNYNAINASLPGWYWLNNCTSLTTLNIGPNVQVIPERAFKDLNFSNAIVIPNTVTTIGYQAFYNCDQITTITIGEGVTTLAGGAITGCDSLTTIHYNAINCNVGNTTIGNGWLYDCPMATTLTIGEHVQSIFKGAFSRRYGGVSFIGNLTLPSSLQSIGEEAFLDCTSFTGNLVIPNSVTSMGKKAFSGCTGFTGNLTIGNGLTVIDEQAFYGCNGFTGTLTIGSSVETIGKEAFKNCNGFTGNLTIPNAVTTLGQECFYGCSGFDGTLTIGEGVSTINPSPFNYCTSLKAINYNAINATKPEWGNWLWNCNALTTLTIGPNVESIFESAFDGKSSLTGNLVIPNSVTTIEKNAFKGCSGFNGTLTLSENLTTIGEAAFRDCTGLTGTLTLPGGLTVIEAEAFRYCRSLTGNLLIPEGVTTIPNDAFRSCQGMTGNLTIPSSVSSIGTNAFNDCGFTTLYYNAINADLDNTWLDYSDNLTTLVIGNQVQVVPDNAFKNKRFEGQLVIPNSVTSIGASAFHNCDYFTGNLVIPNSVSVIGNSAFQDCGGFNGTITLPATITSIGEAAFKDCRNITGTLTLPADLVTIEKEAFREMSSLTGNLIIPNSVEEIKQQAFVNCRGLNGTLTLGTSLETIGQEAFQDCYNLTGSLVFPSSLTTIGNRAFKWCRGFTGDLAIPNSVTSLGEGAFYECYRFDGSLTLPNALEVISYEAFRGCYGLTGDLVIPASVTAINDAAFYNCSGFTGQLVIGESVETLNYDGFNRASNFASVKVKRNVPPTITNSNVFGYWDKTKPVYIPCGTTEAYQAADYWSEFTNYQEQIMIDLFVSSADELMGIAAVTQQPTCENNAAEVTASPNGGYMFVSWTENGEVVSTDNPYIFDLEAERNIVANFDVSPNYWIPVPAGEYPESMTIIGVIEINGVEQYSEELEVGVFCGDECRGTAFANEFYITRRYLAQINVFGEENHILTFRLYDHGLQQELDLNSPEAIAFNEDGYGALLNPYVLNFVSSVEITASVDPIDAGEVTGVGDYLFGSTCTLTAVANDGYQFKNWTLNGVEVSTSDIYTFTVNETAEYVAHFQHAQTTDLVEGWNWFSTFISITDPAEGLVMIEEALGNNGVQIKSIDDFTGFDGEDWFGDLEEATNDKMYMIQVTEDCTITMQGLPVNTEEIEITLEPGWNWIGFPSSEVIAVEDAFAGFEPAANDQIKSLEDYTNFDGEEWFGDLEELTPGLGFMYFNNSGETKVLVFQRGK